jgi:hypothetical protein
MCQTPEKSIVTLINTFTVDRATSSGLSICLFAPRMASSAAHRVLFLRRSIAASTAQRCAQWRSAEAMRQDRGPLPFLEEALTIAKFEPCIYESVRTFLPIGG